MIFNYYEEQHKKVSLANFLEFYNIDMILNNELINTNEYELENYPELEKQEQEEIIYNNQEEITKRIAEEIRNRPIYNLMEDIEEIKEEVISDFLEEKEEEIEENIFYNIEVYQYFIVNPNDLRYLKLLSYPIFYLYEIDLYLIGITHYGTSWSYILTEFNIKNNSIDTDQVFNLLYKN